MTDSKAVGEAVADFATYTNPEIYHTLFSQLRREQPVCWAEPAGYRPFWLITKHSDIREVELNSKNFINQPRVFLAPIDEEDKLQNAKEAGLTAMGRSVVELDGNEHLLFRRMTQSWFAASNVKPLEQKVREIARESIQHMIELGGKCDFVKDVALWYPLRVIMLILGIPRKDEALLLKLTQAMFSPSDPDTESSSGAVGMMEAAQGINDYFHAVTIDRRKTPTGDVATVIANATIDGQLISDRDATAYYVTVITAGHDTTSSTTAAGLLALLEYPEELKKLQNRTVDIDSAINEFLRWGTPIKHFFRTAVSDYKLRGQHIKAGDSVMLCYQSGNRDEDVFADPFSFRVDRKPNPQIAFGFGPHLCLGQHLAKLEMRIFFEELFAGIERMELNGAPALTDSNFIQGLKQLPISYVPKMFEK